MNESEVGDLTVQLILTRLLVAALIGALIGYERRMRHKSIGIAGMVLVSAGSALYMLMAKQMSVTDQSALGRTLQGILQGIGFLGGAVIFKGGTDVRGIKTAAAVWIAGAVGMAVATELWWLGIIGGIGTAVVLFLADIHPRPAEEEKEDDTADRPYTKAQPSKSG